MNNKKAHADGRGQGMKRLPLQAALPEAKSQVCWHCRFIADNRDWDIWQTLCSLTRETIKPEDYCFAFLPQGGAT